MAAGRPEQARPAAAEHAEEVTPRLAGAPVVSAPERRPLRPLCYAARASQNIKTEPTFTVLRSSAEIEFDDQQRSQEISTWTTLLSINC